ncbi:MAG: outer membrane beta-barrel protein [Bacteroidales bacterium]|nr:outer membrane beta-barrel protein [Bacteroidales bacterium]
MKKTLLLIFAAAALMLTGANVSAQVSVGAGPATRLYFEKGQTVVYTYGVQLNFEDSKRLTDVFGYSAGIDFGTYGKKNFFSETSGLNEIYVDIPVRAKFYIPFSEDFELYFFGGVVPSICASALIKTESTRVNRFEGASYYSRYDVLAGGGIGLELNESFRFALGYDHGLLDRYKDDRVLHAAAVKFTFSFLFY